MVTRKKKNDTPLFEKSMTTEWFLRIQKKTIDVYQQVHHLDDQGVLQWIEKNSEFLRDVLFVNNPVQIENTKTEIPSPPPAAVSSKRGRDS